MLGCLAPPLSVYSSALVIYSSPSIIYFCCLLSAIMTGLFPCFIYVIVYFLPISEHFAAIISPELSVLFRDMFFQPILCYKFLITCHTHRPILFMGVLAAEILNVLCHLVAFQHLI